MRKLAREVVFKCIYESLFIDDFSYTELAEDCGLNEQDMPFVAEMIKLYSENREVLEKQLKENLIDYDLDRVYKIDLAIIYAAMTELNYYRDTPASVVINESVELAKKFSTEKSYSFVNGLLKKVLENNDR